MKPQLFIVGRGRSGSTMLVKMLNMHRSIFVAPEGVFIRNLYSKYHQRTNWQSKDLEHFAKDVFTENRIKKLWSFDSLELYHFLKTNLPFNSFAEVCQQLYLLQSEKSGKVGLKLLGDKNPHYSLFTRQLRKLYPQAKFIHLIRHYEANCVSYQGVDFDLNHPIALAYRWKVFNEKIWNHLAGTQNYLIVKYEELVANTEQEMKNICRFLEIDFEPEMLKFYRQTSNTPDWHKNLNKPISNMKYEDDHFDQATKAQLKELCGSIANELGYEESNNEKPLKNVGFYVGLVKGRVVTWLESAIYKLPFVLRNGIINLYRRSVGSR